MDRTDAPGPGPNPRTDRMKAAVLELAVLAGHLLLYPSGLVAERHRTLRPVPKRPVPKTEDPRPDDGNASDRTPLSAPDRAPEPPHGGDPRPVVLLHGFVDNRSVFVVLRRALARAGRGRDRVESFAYSPFTRDLRTAADALARQVAELLARSGHTEVDLVGHSLGGLIARYYVQRLGGDACVRTLVMLGTPHSGTTFGRPVDAHPLIRQMRPGAEVLRELAGPAPGCRTLFVSFWGDLDEVMVPPETARLRHPDLRVRNVRVGGIGHLALPVHPAVVAEVLRSLTDDCVNAPTGQATPAHPASAVSTAKAADHAPEKGGIAPPAEGTSAA
ncbi:lipase family alpha/beta hydrolase [Streptomyces sp. NPDC048718]|uniref:lipase family alpha/beta hydrolase n=1 Tax=Streptomyces sp. NPDC048718 TaxID=3365587 RepID=UPI00371B7AA3